MSRFAVPVCVLLLAACLVANRTAKAAPVPEGACAHLPRADHPSALLSNGETQVLLFLPDAQRGYYRASRFDWSGVVGCAVYNGHSYFGEWFKRYDPMINDAITGPVEEFRSEDGAIGYAAAAPGGLFVKPGVGVLRKIDNSPYRFGVSYPLVDSGKWNVHVKRLSVSFQQKLKGPNGIAYVYTKTVSLDPHGSVLMLRHRLRNVGTAPIKTDVYDHDFFMLDGRPTGAGMTVRFPFEPRLDLSHDAAGMTNPAATIEGKEIRYTRELAQGESFASYLTGYSTEASDYDVTVEDRTSGVGVEQSSDSPIVRFYLWSIHTTICPEAYIHLEIPAGTSKEWTIRYRLYGPPKGVDKVGADTP